MPRREAGGEGSITGPCKGVSVAEARKLWKPSAALGPRGHSPLQPSAQAFRAERELQMAGVPPPNPAEPESPSRTLGTSRGCWRVAGLGWGPPSLVGLLACGLIWGILGMGFPAAGMTRRLLASRSLSGLRPSTGSQPHGALPIARRPGQHPGAPRPPQPRCHKSRSTHVCMREGRSSRDGRGRGSRVCSRSGRGLWDKGGGLPGWCLSCSPLALPIQDESLSLPPLSALSGGFSAPGTLSRGGGAARSQPGWQTGPWSVHREAGEVPAEGEAWGARCLEPVGGSHL